MKTTNVKELKATANHLKRTFTIRKTWLDGGSAKYRTIQLSKEEFESCLNNTTFDWNQFLKSDDYYIVK